MRATVAIALSVVAPSALAVEAQAPPPAPGFRMVSQTAVPMDGTVVATATMEAGRDYLVVLYGTFRFSHNGTAYDARLSTADPQGRAPFGQEHDYVKVSPAELVLVESDPRNHRFVYALAPGTAPSGLSASAAIDVDRMVEDFLIPPSEVRRGLSGELMIQLWERPEPAAGGLLAHPLVRAGGVLLLLVIVSLILLARSGTEVAARERRLDGKYRQARAAALAGGGFFAELVRELDSLRESARLIGRSARRYRIGEGTARELALRAEIAALERKVAAAPDERVRADGEAALAAKREALAVVERGQASREHALMRLTKIEAAFDAARARVEEIRAGAAPAEGSEDVRIDGLTAELDLVRRTLDDAGPEVSPGA